MRFGELLESNEYEIHNHEKLDKILVKLCEMIIDSQKQDPEYFGMVAAAVLDPDNNLAAAVNYPHEDGKRVHAERAAMELYVSKYASSIPKGSIIITTLSPCNEDGTEMSADRHGESCTELINNSTVHKVYCGYQDPSQGDNKHDERTFTLEETRNPEIRKLCEKFANTFLKDSPKESVIQHEGVNMDELNRILELSGLNLTADEQFDIIEEMIESLAAKHGVDPEVIWEDIESVDDEELLDESAAWKRSAGKSKSGGLNAKGVASYRREHPGSKLQTAVTTKPSKLKKGSKAAKRRKSFCARMGGVKGPMKKPNGKPTRKALALRKWNCEE